MFVRRPRRCAALRFRYDLWLFVFASNYSLQMYNYFSFGCILEENLHRNADFSEKSRIFLLIGPKICHLGPVRPLPKGALRRAGVIFQGAEHLSK